MTFTMNLKITLDGAPGKIVSIGTDDVIVKLDDGTLVKLRGSGLYRIDVA